MKGRRSGSIPWMEDLSILPARRHRPRFSLDSGLRAQSGLGLGGRGGYPKEATWQVTKASTYASGQGVWSVWFTPGLGYSEDSV